MYCNIIHLSNRFILSGGESMKITLRTFELLTVATMLLGMFFAFSSIQSIRIFGYLVIAGGAYLLHEIDEERRRQRQRARFYRRISRLVVNLNPGLSQLHETTRSDCSSIL